MITSDDVVGFVTRSLTDKVPAIGVYWHQSRADRHEVAERLRAAKAEVCVVPLLPRRGFDNANALASDVAELLEESRQSIESVVREAGRRQQPIAFVLVSRIPLGEPQLASPVRLPDWMPYGGGRVVPLDIVDIAATAAATLRAESESVGRLQVLLFEIQGLMLHRLLGMLERDKNATHRFFGELLKEDTKPMPFLVQAEERHRKSTPDGFRAVASPKAPDLLGRLVASVGERSPSQLPSFGSAMCEALGIAPAALAQLHEPVMAVAFRSTIKEFEMDRPKRAARNAALMLYCASQLSTAAAHAGEYGEFGVLPMRTFMRELEDGLASFKSLLL